MEPAAQDILRERLAREEAGRKQFDERLASATRPPPPAAAPYPGPGVPPALPFPVTPPRSGGRWWKIAGGIGGAIVLLIVCAAMFGKSVKPLATNDLVGSWHVVAHGEAKSNDNKVVVDGDSIDTYNVD